MRIIRKALASGAAVAICAIMSGVAQAQPTEVIHWWTSKAESAGIKVIADAFNQSGGEWKDEAVAGSSAAKTAAINRIVGGNAPDAAQFSMGADINNLVESGLLANLDAVADAGNWSKVIPPSVMSAISRDGHIYAVPIQLQATNFLFASKAALDKVAATMPKTWDEFFATGDKLRAAGIVPYAQAGDRDVWFMNTFAAVLASVSGAEGWKQFTGPKGADYVRSDAFKPVAEILAKLPKYADGGVSGRQWNVTNQMILKGEAGFFIMGGWAIGEIVAAGKKPGEDVLCSIGPNNAPAVVNGDVWAMPIKGGSLSEVQKKLAELTISVDVQSKFTTAMGSLPIRSGVDASGYNACAAAGASAIEKRNSVSALMIPFSPEKVGALGAELKVLWAKPDAKTDDYVKAVAGVLEKY
ncbi:glucose/mannose transport system substrate-binding protein [Rhizobium pisi]